jgi:hypothetical protein
MKSIINKEVLYVIRHDRTKTVKIGITVNWDARSKSLKLGQKTTLLRLYNCPDICSAEKELHDKYRDIRLPGSEYFYFDDSELISFFKETDNAYTNITNDYKNFQAINKHPWLDISGSVQWSISDWFRLNQKSWFRDIVEYLYICLVVVSEDDPEKADQYNKFINQFDKFCKTIKVPYYYNGWSQSQYVAEKIWDEITNHYGFAIPKKDFKLNRHLRNEPYQLHGDYDLNKIKFVNISGQEPCLNGLQITPIMIQVLFENLADYRLHYYAERAYNCFTRQDGKFYYWESYGPLEGNQPCVLAFQ